MYFPKLKAAAQQRAGVEQFGGLDRRPGSGAGSLEHMENLWSSGYPALETRPLRRTVTQLTKPNGMTEKDGLFWVDGTALYVNGAKTGLVLTDSRKQLVSMGAYLLIFPDKKYINTQDLTDFGSMENVRTTTGEVTFTLCDGTGESLGSYAAGTEAPQEPRTGDLWLDTERSESVMRRYDGSTWTALTEVYTKIAAVGVGLGFRAGDGVTVAGCGAAELNGLHVLQAAEDDWVLVPALCRTLDSQTAAVTVMRLMPEMDFVVEQGNRLWGCKYGIVDGQAVNEIYACALGDFRNWNSFAGLSTDSYAAARGSDGPFTGAAACMGGVVFFKENCAAACGRVRRGPWPWRTVWCTIWGTTGCTPLTEVCRCAYPGRWATSGIPAAWPAGKAGGTGCPPWTRRERRSCWCTTRRSGCGTGRTIRRRWPSPGGTGR